MRLFEPHLDQFCLGFVMWTEIVVFIFEDSMTFWTNFVICLCINYDFKTHNNHFSVF